MVLEELLELISVDGGRYNFNIITPNITELIALFMILAFFVLLSFKFKNLCKKLIKKKK